MANMPHCNFYNTLQSLINCHDAMRDFAPNELSFEEQVARWNLIRRCQVIVSDFGHETDEPRPFCDAA